MAASRIDARFGAWCLLVLAVLLVAGCSGSEPVRSSELRRDATDAPGTTEAGVSYLDDPKPSPFWIAVMVDDRSPLAEFSQELGVADQADRWDRFRDEVTAQCDQEVGSWNQTYDDTFYVRALEGHYLPSLRERKANGFGVVLERLGQPIAVSNTRIAVATNPSTCIEQVRDSVYAAEATAFAALGDTYPEFWAVLDVAIGPLKVPNVYLYDHDFWESCMRQTTGLDNYLAVTEAIYQNEDLTLDEEREIAIEDWYCRQPALQSWIDTAYDHQDEYIYTHRDQLATILTPNG